MTAVRIAILAALLAVSGPGPSWAQRYDEATALAELAQARAPWAGAGIVRYRLSIGSERAYCQATFEIEQERVLTITQLPLHPRMPCVVPGG